MLADIWCRMFCLQFAIQKYKDWDIQKYKFAFVLYGCETWLLTLREERRLKVFENRVLRRIFWSKREKVTGEWRRLRNEEINDLYCSPNITWVIKLWRMRWVGHVAHMGEKRGFYRVVVGKPEGKRPLGIPKYRWEDDNVMALQKWDGGHELDWAGSG